MQNTLRRDINWRELRSALGLTQEQMAGLLLVAERTISNYEVGATAASDQTLLILRALLAGNAELRSRLVANRYPTPWPEDL